MRSLFHSLLKFMNPRVGEGAASSSTVSKLLVGISLFCSLTGVAEASGGFVITDISSRAYAMVIDSSGRIVTAGSPLGFGVHGYALTRYNSDGLLDTTFGNGGLVTTDIKGHFLGVADNATAMDNLGRIIVAGTSYPLPYFPTAPS
jgi:Domain of unknown function (DUF5122) beta-propeller